MWKKASPACLFILKSKCEDSISQLEKGTAIVIETGKAFKNVKKPCESCSSTQKYNQEPGAAGYEEISILQKLLRIIKDEGDKMGEEACLHQLLGITYYEIGEYEKAMRHLKEGLALAQDIGDKCHEGTVYENLAACYQCLGQNDKAMSCVQEGLKIAKEIGDKSDVGVAHRNIGACYDYLGQDDEAISHLKQGLKIANEIGDKGGEGRAFQNLGVCYLRLGQFENAISHLRRGLEIAKEIGDKSGEGAAYKKLGLCCRSLGHFKKAISHLEKGLEIAEEIGDKRDEGAAYLDLGACYQSLGQFDKAIYHSQQGLVIANEIGDKRSKAKACHNLGTTYESLQDTENAERMLRNSVKCSIELFNNVSNLDAGRVSYIDTFIDTSDDLIDNLVCQGKTDEALIVAEECRTMSLKYLMNSGNFVPTSSHDPDQLNLQQIREMGKSLDRGGVIYFALPHGKICTWIIDENDQIRLFKTKVGEELDKKEKEGEEKVNSVKILVDNLIKLALREVNLCCDGISITEEETTGAKVQRFFQADPKLVLSVLVGELFALMKPENKAQAKCDDRSLSFLYPEVPRPTEKVRESVPPKLETFHAHICKASRSDGTQRRPVSPGAQGLQKQGTPAIEIHQRNRETRTEISGTEQLMHVLLAFLYKLLLYPVRQHIAGSQVVIVPDGPLALVPFAALVDENGRYVAESGARIRLVPSLAVGHIISKRPRNPIRKALIIGDPHVHKILKDGEIVPVPRIPSAVKEAELIGRVLHCKPLTGRKATKEEFLRNIESADLIHIAAHGDAERGEILLASPSGTDEDQAVPVDEVMLKMSDLETGRIRAQLVVLTSCYSARGKVQGEGVVGMARAFLGAGARAVLVALWAVDDEVTYYMIGIFYEGLEQGKSASEALSDAMKVVRESQDRFRHPRFWAPFILLGDDVSHLGEEGCNIHKIRS